MPKNEQVTVVIGTFGDADEWAPLVQRASDSAWKQTVQPLEVLHSHAGTLADARNQGGAQARGEWLIFLDADDELDEGYIEAMLAAPGDLRRPATLGVTDGIPDDEPYLIPRKPLLSGNYIVIGAMCRRDQFIRVGGFRDMERLEDWELWIRFALDGAEIVDVPEAIYKVHVRQDSRNQGDNVHGKIYRNVREEYRMHHGKNGL